MKTTRFISVPVAGVALAVISALAACGYTPDQKVVARLSDENYALLQDKAKLEAQIKDRDATVEHLRAQISPNVAPVQTLPRERLAELFTLGGVSLRKGTDAEDFTADGVQDGFRVLLRTSTAEGHVMPATGTVTIEAFDLAAAKDAIALGSWTFTPAQLKASWVDGFGLYHFGLNCPWSVRPAHDEITFKVKFVDALTGSVFTDEQKFRMHYRGPATQPATAPK